MDNNVRPRTIAVSFPRTDEGDAIYNALLDLKHAEDRSCSKIIYRMIRECLSNDNVVPLQSSSHNGHGEYGRVS